MLTIKGNVYSWGLAANGQLGVRRAKGLMNNLEQKNGIQYAPTPQLIKAFKGKVIEKVIAKRNCAFAISDSEKVYCWGHLPKGLNFNPYEEIIDEPKRNDAMQGMNFRDITLSQDSAVAIARSVLLNFEI